MRIQNIWKITVLSVFICLTGGCDKKPAQTDGPVTLSYVELSGERVTLTNDLPGRVSSLVVSGVRPQVDGIILERLFEEGVDVVKGQVLYQIDPAIYQATYNTAKADLAEAEATAAALALLEKRYRNLIKKSAVSQQDLDNAISDLGQAQARITRAQAELEAAAINLAYTKVKAPISGRIGISTVTPGALVTANQPDALAVIHQTDRVYVDITQPGADTIRLRRAMALGRMSSSSSAAKVRLRLEDGSPYTLVTRDFESDTPEWLHGDLLFSEVSVDRATGRVSVRAVFNNPDGLLLSGMYVTAIIEEGTLDNAVLIPQSSVLSSISGGHFVYLLTKDASGADLFQVQRREVGLDRTFGNSWIVKNGLKPGELLVVEGLQKAVFGGVVKGVLAQQAGLDPSDKRPATKAR